MAYLARNAERSRPPLDGFTPEQRFFLGCGQVWCENVRPERARMLRADRPALAGPRSA